MSIDSFKHQLFEQFSRIGKALSNANRLELLELLAQGERPVDALAKASCLSVANTSQHLQQLRQAGLVAARKEGQSVYYSLADPAVVELMSQLRRIAQHNLADVERLVSAYLTVKDSLEPISSNELLERARGGLVTIVDVRPPEEYVSGHLRGAVNIPLAEIEKRIGTLPRSQEIIAYCRGPYCVLAYDAVSKLREKGFTARRLASGYPEWEQEGLPVEHGQKE